ncbi:thioesterase II family protein [Streptosporangium algeriense]|uniref:Thioesterase II family protein n=1 Tax=Streptosporangium algeriense TaxID=1682748 RepID=A0ABW3DKH4_9ACTN
MAVDGTLIAFPAAGGGKWMFTGLRRALPPGLKLVVPDLPGRGKRTRDTSVGSVAELVTELCDELEPEFHHGRYVLFGSCFGSLVAFELLREIRRRGHPMAEAFVVSARKPPDIAESYRAYAGWTDEQLGGYLDYIWPAERVNGENGALGALRGLVIRQLRRDVQIAANYDFEPERVFDLPIYAYRGADDQSITAEELKTWRSHTSGPFTFRAVTGGRDFYADDCDRLVADLEQVLT